MIVEPPFVFLSYSRTDRTYANDLVAWLRERGINVWYDQDIRAGQPWQPTLERQLRACRAVIVLMSEAAAAGVGVPQEVALAKRAGKKFYPIRLGPTRFATLSRLQEEPCLDGAFPSPRWTDEVREFLAGPEPAPRRRWWRRPGVVPGVAAAAVALLAGAALLDGPASHTSPDPSAAAPCAGLAARIDSVSEESPGHTGRGPMIAVTVCTAAPSGHEYWIMDWTDGSDSKTFYAKRQINGAAGTAAYQVTHSPATEVGSERSYVLVDVPQAASASVRSWTTDDDRVPVVPAAQSAPRGVSLISAPARRAL